MPTPQVKITKIGWALCIMSVLCLIAWLVLTGLESRKASSDEQNLTFIKSGVFEVCWILAFISTASLFCLLLYCILKKDGQARTLVWALALSLSLFPVTVMLSLPVAFYKVGTWRVEANIKGTDHHTYYLLYAPPPLAGDGKGALARRTGGNFFYYTMHIVLVDYYGNQNTVLHTGLKSPDPNTRRTCRMLLDTIKQRSAARKKPDSKRNTAPV